ncbi:glycoside hydrolase family 36 protein [Haladaptatus paucihalophilus]|uniref:glycoside hydrolase family 36 protein n=1 Tax=Haladaptatus paucihalophilus TaxID=367189 RepID=UPI00035ED4C8|nr:glycoside hydrolase family 36 protein [Haladaptatus paucihalophilus]
MLERTRDATTLRYDIDEAQLSIHDANGVVFAGSPGVVLDGELVTPDGSEARSADATLDDSTPAVVHRCRRDGGEPVELRLELDTHPSGVVVTMELENESETAVTVDSFRIAGGNVEFGSDARVYRHGYQSWTPTGALPVGERFPPENEDAAPMMYDLATDGETRTSNYVTAVADGSRSLTLGFLDHDRYVTRFDIADDSTGVSGVTAVCPADGYRLARGETLTSSPLLADASRTVSDALAAWASAVGERIDARFLETVPTGWCSWYHYFTDVSEADVRENAEGLNEWGIPVALVQVDDGYTTAIGDWRSVNDDFSDMGALAADIESAGYTPGIWLAPFHVAADSAVATEHPEWLIADEDGPVGAGFRSGEYLYGLDATHPEVQTWLRETFHTVVHEWGYDYLKLDFLFAAALPGDYHDETATRADAYRTGLSIIRDVAGDETFILGCGAPIGPSVGIVDAMRIGPDVDPVWETPGESDSQPALKNAVRNTLNRQFTHRRLWLNDPDCQLVRTTTDLTDAERRAFAAVVALTGGLNVFSDAIEEIDDAGRNLLERTLPPARTGDVVGVGSEEFPDRLVCDHPFGDGATIAAFNWTDEPATVSVSPEEVGVSSPVAWDAFEERAVSLDGAGIERTLAPHDALLVHLSEPTDRPGVTGTRDALTGESGAIRSTSWDDGTLTIERADAPPVEALVSVPEGWSFDGEDLAGGEDGTRIFAVELEAAVTELTFSPPSELD